MDTILIISQCIAFLLVLFLIAVELDYYYFWMKSYKLYMNNIGMPPTGMFSGWECWLECKKRGLL
jgi:hypothetical protein